jgi:hypothetical protein
VFDSTSSASLNLTVHAVGVRSYASYTTAVATAKPNVASFQNACAMAYPPADAPPIAGGVEQIGSGASSAFGTVLAPFPISIFDATSEEVWFSTSGVVGVGPIPPADHPTSGALPGASSTNFFNAVYAFWSGLKTGSTYQGGGVCTVVVGTAPSRTLVVTWADMSFATEQGTTKSDLYFSALFHEGSDVVDLQYYYPLGGPAAYLFGSSGFTSGTNTVSATTIGIQGNATTAAQYGSAGVVNTPNTQFTVPGAGTNILLPYTRRGTTTITFTPQ